MAVEQNVTLESLAGLHKLKGVDFGTANLGEYYGDSTSISFNLDGVVYTGIENPDDGYRSSLDKLIVSKDKIKNKFKSVSVMALARTSCRYGKADVLELVDVKTGKVVLEVGTNNTDDYYPSFVGNFYPENMCINAK